MESSSATPSPALPLPPLFPQSPSSHSSGSLSVAGFSPNTLYSCSMTAENSQGSGPPAVATFTTQQDCLFSCVTINFFRM
ncbi:hypothetical protein GBAR_LOCUS25106 [Geodia barretti]|uniref:Fibronectin type-III domain-containing protein n=1 Tax=Geodia barretti TaxID=519541 RepID=A0AA35TBR6_GEOBA|nr:hypothetical protein GBAR_LOCUS25106 [Geodia barretti]